MNQDAAGHKHAGARVSKQMFWLCYTESMRLNLNSIREDSRRVGIILGTTGLLGAVLDQVDSWIGASLGLTGLALLLIASLESENG